MSRGKLLIIMQTITLCLLIVLSPIFIYKFMEIDLEDFIVYGITLIWAMLFITLLHVFDIYERVVIGERD
jgi:hypothetical protein